MRHLLTVLGALLLAGCGGKEEAPPAERADPVRDAAEAVTAGTRTPLTLADAERVGFARQEDKAYAMVDAIDGAGGTLEGSGVEIYVYEGTPPAEQVELFRGLAGPDAGFGWAGVCEVGNLVMVYKDEAACQVLRTLER